tara:strand:- start:737 stop:1564 length:828 start_codon:yes stop_codon:yes gene_type:complete
MILWLASYPKSGNTFVRALISSYLNSEDDNVFSKIKGIRSFPKKSSFDGIVDDDLIKKDHMQLFKYFLSAQKKINENNKLNFVKTHNFFGSTNGYEFTDRKNTAGVIHIVRDPRAIAVSYAHHSDISFKKSVDLLLMENRIGINDGGYPEARMSWKIHFNSWFNCSFPKLLIKYEDLNKDTYNNFKKILVFINQFLRNKFEIDEDKIKKTIEICSFNNLSRLESEIGFNEKQKNVKFFRKGENKEWETVLPSKLISQIENHSLKELKKLNYIKTI